MLNKIINNFNKTINSFNRLNLLHKLFIIFLILIFVVILYNNHNNNDLIEQYENEKGGKKGVKFSKKIDGDIYDDHYSKYYDAIHLNKNRNKFEVGEIMKLEEKRKNTKLLDVGSGTGYTVKLLKDNELDVTGLDKSGSMVSKAKANYPKCKFVEGDILNNEELDYNAFSHISCLGKTIYEIKNKEEFFENCYNLLNESGYLILNLADRDKFKPYVQDDKKNILFNPEKYNKKIEEFIVKFDKNTEFISTFKKLFNDDSTDKFEELNNNLDDDVVPYVKYNEKFENYKTHKIRKNENNLYMPELNNIVNLAKRKGFYVLKNINMDQVNHENEYLYVFKKSN